ncbi:MAG: DNA polymerase III subunit alpha [Oscillospiraceae bacterium]|nr:DNA polymerase III subunit alpha [Oscillospiraceae bacterium]
MPSFTHLHVHTEYSLLDGACKLGPLISRAAELGMTSLAITDHGVMYGAVDFYKECKKQGIKPIIGCEVYVAPRTRKDKQHGVDNSPYHLILLCENQIGYQNLIKLVSMGFIEGFYSKPRVDRELLVRHSEGLICLSACLAGEVPRALQSGDYARAKEAALWYRDTFGEGNYYIEIQDHRMPEQREILPLLHKLSEETGIPMAATNDSHYIAREDSKMQNVLVCIQTNRTVDSGSDMEFVTDEFYLKSPEEMDALFADYPGAVANTAKIAERCNLDFTFGETKLPHFTAPEGADNAEYFRALCLEGLHTHYGDSPGPEVTDRLDFELGVIEKMGYTDYFLIVWDFIRYAKEQGISVGPGRGSGAGSLAAFCSGITGIDPIKYGLLFEHFLNPERISMPDFDIDFCYERRQEVIEYVTNKYGSDHVAQIITFGTMAARGSVRDVGRALGMTYQQVDVIAKSIPFELGMTIERALQVSPEFGALYQSDPQNKELIDMARKIEGMVRHASTHAAGVVITRESADVYVPLQSNDGSIVTQYPMGILEELGLLKMDFLGLRNLTVIKDSRTMIRRHQPDFEVESISLDDRPVFEMLGRGQTNGVFQFESQGMKNVLTQLKPDHFEDLIAVISLYRPGPMESIPRYIHGRHNPGEVRYPHPMLEPILKVTYGCIVYQEQVMQICRELAGYSYGRADLVRRAMSKKKHDVMEKERRAFIHGEEGPQGCVGCVRGGVPEPVANDIFEQMSSFASYAFNKSHAAAYAMLSYQTAYLKCHYPKEYMAALLTSILDSTDKVIDYIGECKRLGLKVLPPDINESEHSFTVVGESIRFGLLAVKNLGRKAIQELCAERERAGKFLNLEDFLRRMQGKELGKRGIENLIRCGALDSFGHTRQQMEKGFPALYEDIEKDAQNNISGQMDLFSTAKKGESAGYVLPDLPEHPPQIRLAYEKETTGLYLSGHPLEAHEETAGKIGAIPIAQLHQNKRADGERALLLGILAGRKLKTTKSNEMMAFAQLEDKTGTIEIIIFPKTYAQSASMLAEGQVVAVRGRIKETEEGAAQLVCEEILAPEDAGKDGRAWKPDLTNECQDSASVGVGFHPRPPVPTPATAQGGGRAAAGKQGLYLKFPGQESELVGRAQNLLAVFEGPLPVYFYYSDAKKLLRTPKTYWVAPNDVLTRELGLLLGEKNVALVQ